MFPFVKVRKTKSNLSLAKDGGEKAFDEDQYEDKQNKEDGKNKDESSEGYKDEDQYRAHELENSLKKSTEEILEKRDTPSLKRKLTGKIEKTKSKVRKREKSENEEGEFKALQVINKLASAEEIKGECKIFGELTVTELKTLNQKQSLLSKHKIQNVLFKIRMQSLEFDSNDRPTELAAKTTMQYPSTSTSTSAVSFQSIAKLSYQYFQPPHSDGLSMKLLRFFVKEVQDAASYNSE